MHNYVIESQIGAGKFGKVYKGFNKINKNAVAIKVENWIDSLEGKNRFSLLKNEATVINYLCLNKCPNIPKIYWYGKSQKETGMSLIETFLNGGSLLEKVSNLYGFSVACEGKLTFLAEASPKPKMNFSKQSAEKLDLYINRIMQKMIYIIKNVHDLQVIHRDIKPHNFMFSGKIEEGELYLIDFGLATFVDDFKIEENKEEHIIGTPNYISYFIHDGCSPSKCDDLISIGYIYLFLRSKYLLWDKKNTNFSSEQSGDKKNTNFSSEQSGDEKNRIFSSKQSEDEKEFHVDCEDKSGLPPSHILHPNNQRIKKFKEIHFLNENICFDKREPIIQYMNYLYHFSSFHSEKLFGLSVACEGKFRKINYEELINLFRG